MKTVVDYNAASFFNDSVSDNETTQIRVKTQSNTFLPI